MGPVGISLSLRCLRRQTINIAPFPEKVRARSKRLLRHEKANHSTDDMNVNFSVAMSGSLNRCEQEHVTKLHEPIGAGRHTTGVYLDSSFASMFTDMGRVRPRKSYLEAESNISGVSLLLEYTKGLFSYKSCEFYHFLASLQLMYLYPCKICCSFLILWLGRV